MRRAKRKGYNLTQAFAKQARRNENPTAAGHGEELLRESEGENQDWNDLGMVEDINFNNQDTVEGVDDNVNIGETNANVNEGESVLMEKMTELTIFLYICISYGTDHKPEH